MTCHSCGAQLPEGVAYCTECGAAVSDFNVHDMRTTRDIPGVVPSPYQVAQQLPPAVYASAPYGIAPSTPYYSPPAYDPNTPLPPPPPPLRRGNRIGVIAVIVLLLLILIGGSVFVFLARSGSRQAPRHTVNATATAVALQNPYTHSGTLAFFDPLSDNSKGHDWDKNRNCAFMDGAYHDIAPDPNFSDYCTTNATDLSNFAFEVQMRVIKGDAGGILFRIMNTTSANQYYLFNVDQKGSYGFDIINGSKDSPVANGTSQTIKQGLNQTNLLAVVVQGTNITLYINHHQIAHAIDNTYSHGQIGVFASPNESHPTEVVYSNVRVWML